MCKFCIWDMVLFFMSTELLVGNRYIYGLRGWVHNQSIGRGRLMRIKELVQK